MSAAAADATAAPPKKRRAWLAALLNAFSFGLGFLYLGRPKWAFATLLALPAAIGALAWTRLILFPLGFLAMVAAIVAIWIGSTAIAALVARRQPAAPLARYQRWYVYIGYFVLTLACQQAISSHRASLFGYEPFRFPSASMEDTLRPGDRFLSDTWSFRSRDPERGELVVFRYPPDRSIMYVKRVIGIPGDIVRIERGRVWINGVALNEPYVNPEKNRERQPGEGEYRVPPRSYFVLGDNRDNSADSRVWGFVPREDLHGSVGYIWSFGDRFGLRPR